MENIYLKKRIKNNLKKINKNYNLNQSIIKKFNKK